MIFPASSEMRNPQIDKSEGFGGVAPVDETPKMGKLYHTNSTDTTTRICSTRMTQIPSCPHSRRRGGLHTDRNSRSNASQGSNLAEYTASRCKCVMAAPALTTRGSWKPAVGDQAKPANRNCPKATGPRKGRWIRLLNCAPRPLPVAGLRVGKTDGLCYG